MKKTVLKFGLYGGLLIITLFLCSYSFMDSISYSMQEVFGYLSMFIALIFVFFGIKSYRDKENGGKISFGKALGLGILITLIPALAFGIFDAIYVTYIYPEFFDNYYAMSLEQLSNAYTGEELAAKIAEMDAMMVYAKNPLFTFGLMFFTVFILGFIVSLISSMILRRSEATA